MNKFYIFLIILITIQNCKSKPTTISPKDSITIKSFDLKKQLIFKKTAQFVGFPIDFYFNMNDLKEFNNIESLELNSPLFKNEDICKIPNIPVQYLNLNYLNISNIDCLNSKVQIHSLLIRKTKIKNIDALNSLSKITRLDISETEIDNLEFVKNYPELRRLFIRRTKISDLSPLKNTPKLIELYMGYSKVKQLKPLYGLENLINLEIDELDIHENQLITLRKKNPHTKIIRWGKIY